MVRESTQWSRDSGAPVGPLPCEHHSDGNASVPPPHPDTGLYPGHAHVTSHFSCFSAVWSRILYVPGMDVQMDIVRQRWEKADCHVLPWVRGQASLPAPPTPDPPEPERGCSWREISAELGAEAEDRTENLCVALEETVLGSGAHTDCVPGRLGLGRLGRPSWV